MRPLASGMMCSEICERHKAATFGLGLDGDVVPEKAVAGFEDDAIGDYHAFERFLPISARRTRPPFEDQGSDSEPSAGAVAASFESGLDGSTKGDLAIVEDGASGRSGSLRH